MSPLIACKLNHGFYLTALKSSAGDICLLICLNLSSLTLAGLMHNSSVKLKFNCWCSTLDISDGLFYYVLVYIAALPWPYLKNSCYGYS